MRTSSPRRWIWMRIPSSFHSTDERSKPSTASATLSAVEASIGRIGRKISRPTSRRPSSPLVSAISAVRVRSPDSISARRASRPGTPAAFATASTISPASAPCLSSPVKRRLTKSASGSVARASRSPRSSSRPAADPLPSTSWTAAIARSRSAIVERRLRGGRALDRRRSSSSRHRPVPAEARPARKPTASATSSGVEPPQQVGEDRDLLRARAGGGDVARRGHDLCQQGHRCAKRGSRPKRTTSDRFVVTHDANGAAWAYARAARADHLRPPSNLPDSSHPGLARRAPAEREPSPWPAPISTTRSATTGCSTRGGPSSRD